MKFWIATASALAMAATPALAQGNGNGNGNGQGQGQGQQAQQGNRGGGGGNGQAQRGNQGGGQDTRGNQGNGGGQDARGNRGNGGGGGQDARGNQGNGGGNAQAARGNADRGSANRPEVRGDGNSGNGNGNGNANRVVRANNPGNTRINRGGDTYRADSRTDRYEDYTRDYRDWDRDRDGGFFNYVNDRGYSSLDGCPPGLARKNNGCNPPGQLRQSGDWDRYSDRYSRYSPDWWGLSGYDRGNYFYNDGYLMRYDGNRIGGYIPLFGGALSVGNVWPTNYGYQSMPSYYSDYYGFGDDYRYADNVVYRLDPETAAIQSVAALLTGNDFVVGQPMPQGYDVYNVPYSYRDRYYDTPEANYRYNNGYVYQVDPATMLVSSAIEMIL